MPKPCPTCGGDRPLAGRTRPKYCSEPCKPRCLVDGCDRAQRKHRMCASHANRKDPSRNLRERRRALTGELWCPDCERMLPPSEFHGRSEGRKLTWCKSCRAARRSELYRARKAGEIPLVVVEAQECVRCHLSKPADGFGRNAARANGLKQYCLACQRVMNRMAKYGLSWEEAIALGAVSACAICGQEGDLVIDHDHETGAVRGAICGNCNRGLGGFRDSVDHLMAASAYLMQNSNLLVADGTK